MTALAIITAVLLAGAILIGRTVAAEHRASVAGLRRWRAAAGHRCHAVPVDDPDGLRRLV